MDGTPVKKLARDTNTSVADLIKQLQDSGVEVSTENDLVTGEQQLRLLKQRRMQEKAPDPNQIISVGDLEAATDLAALNDLLTKAMAGRTIQSLIKDEDLQTVVDAIVKRASDEDRPLLAAAMLGRLAAVARPARATGIFERVNQVLTKEPASLLSLVDSDGKQKLYAAQMLSHVSAPWVAGYRYREALAIDTADNTRRELLAANLAHEGTLADWIETITRYAPELDPIGSAEARLKRIRRVLGSMRDVADRWRDDVGADVGLRLAECMKAFLTGELADLEQPVLFEAVDHVLAILVRVIQLRFSTALSAATYALLDQGKRILGLGLWGRFVFQSSILPEVRVALLETALVLARQNRSDTQIMAALSASFTSLPQVAAAIKRHFQDARDLDPDVADWWRRVGEVSVSQRRVEHRVGNTEDSQIGALLIEVENNREAMEKVGRAVVPLLEISEPVLASTVKKAVEGYQGIAQTARRLARMRKLETLGCKGERMEYNPLEHEMLGGHKPGVRRVKIVRDGIQKDFAGKKKTLVKPWVEAEED